ncbi:ATP-dependent helicase DinG [Bacillus sp. HMF5848]|uniref:ATP-dependent DNA helicase DinG n=1 Tax=Bacillus sp. HMF5848 TaxID=2495421 RepID=UPI000F77F326|nr:ATP-dependent DNA helicase DinG [Bacillus sp. HMF5848]RSK27402.1 ATP-dependent helicase DinG [Bacillus sp. HMF5848]
MKTHVRYEQDDNLDGVIRDMLNRYVIIDLETTGNTPKDGAKIIQVAALLVENDQIVETFESFVNPGIPIPQFIQDLTGITNEMVAKAPIFADLAPLLWDMFSDSYFVAHNVPFDLSFLKEELLSSGFLGVFGPTIDTVELSRVLYPTIQSYKLEHLADYFGFEHDNPHRADSDALVTTYILLELLNKLKKLPIEALKHLEKLSKGFKSDIRSLLLQVIDSRLYQYDPNAYDVYDGIAVKKQPPVLNHDKVVMTYEDIRNKLITYADKSQLGTRDSQLQMMDIVADCLQTNQHALIEAGAGVGKTIAYSIPAIIQALQARKPVIISTYTTNLQSQLVERDLPKIRDLLNVSYTFAMLKGRHHFIHIQKLAHYLQQYDTRNYDITLTLAQIVVWLTETEAGDVDELNLSTGGLLVWEDIHCGYENKINVQSNLSFFRRALDRVEQADIIVINHALLASDLKQESMLPKYDAVIIDEAHHFEDVYANVNGIEFDYVTIHHYIQQLGVSGIGGLVQKLNELLRINNAPSELRRAVSVSQLIQLREDVDLFFRALRQYTLKMTKNNSIPSIASYRIVPSKQADNDMFINLTTYAANVCEGVAKLISDLSKQISYVRELHIFSQLEDEIFLAKTIKVIDNLNEMYSLIEDVFFANDDEEYLNWVEIETKGAENAATLFRRAMTVAEPLANQLYMHKKSVILTSATLTIDVSFSFIEQRLGLVDFFPVKTRIESPYNYKEKAAILVPKGLPDIKKVPQDMFVFNICEYIKKIITAVDGRTLLLFTSHEMLSMAYQILKNSEELQSYILLCQGISSGNRKKLIKNYYSLENSILMGTYSLWEGIDATPKDFGCVVLVRLPFSPPNEPVMSARSEKALEQGGSPFYDVSLPDAIIRFKQGFGRLIRSNNSKGVLVVLDHRIIYASYGPSFIKSLPEVPIYHEEMEPLVKRLNELKKL